MQTTLAFQGAKKVSFTACHSGKLQLAFTSPKVIFTRPMMARVDNKFYCDQNSLKIYLPDGQVKNRIHQPNSKIHQPRAIRDDFLCTLLSLILPAINVQRKLPEIFYPNFILLNIEIQTYQVKVLLKRFHLNGHYPIAFHLQTHKWQ